MFKKELFNQVLTIPFETMSNIFEDRGTYSQSIF